MWSLSNDIFNQDGDLLHFFDICYAIPKIKILHNLSCLETRFRLMAVDNSLHSSLNLAFTQYKLHNFFIFGMAYLSNLSSVNTFLIEKKYIAFYYLNISDNVHLKSILKQLAILQDKY